MKQKYTMSAAARAARMKGGVATSKKFSAIRRTRKPRAAVWIDRDLKNWAVDRFGNVDLALSEFKDLCEKEAK